MPLGALRTGDLRLNRLLSALCLQKPCLSRQISEVLAEGGGPWTYLKFPYYRPLGPELGSYRVGPLARLNVCTPSARSG